MINTGTSSQAWNILDKIQQDVRTDYARLRVEQCFLSDENPRDEINLLSDEACEYLINHTDKHIDGGRIDTVDGEHYSADVHDAIAKRYIPYVKEKAW